MIIKSIIGLGLIFAARLWFYSDKGAKVLTNAQQYPAHTCIMRPPVLRSLLLPPSSAGSVCVILAQTLQKCSGTKCMQGENAPLSCLTSFHARMYLLRSAVIAAGEGGWETNSSLSSPLVCCDLGGYKKSPCLLLHELCSFHNERGWEKHRLFLHSPKHVTRWKALFSIVYWEVRRSEVQNVSWCHMPSKYFFLRFGDPNVAC